MKSFTASLLGCFMIVSAALVASEPLASPAVSGRTVATASWVYHAVVTPPMHSSTRQA